MIWASIPHNNTQDPLGRESHRGFTGLVNPLRDIRRVLLPLQPLRGVELYSLKPKPFNLLNPKPRNSKP